MVEVTGGTVAALLKGKPTAEALDAIFAELVRLSGAKPGLFRSVGTEIYAMDPVPGDGRGAAIWCERLIGMRKFAADGLFQIAVLMSKLTGDTAIATSFLNTALQVARDEDDGVWLRQLRAACVSSLLRPQVISAIGGPSRKKWLNDSADAALRKLHAAVADRGPVANRELAHGPVEHKIVLSVAWVPANADFGAHLRQLCSYSHGLILAGRAAGQSVRLKLLFTYDATTNGMVQNFQGYSPAAVSALEQAFSDALGVDKAFVDLVHCHPMRFASVQDWIASVEREVVAFAATAALRWYGFYGSDVIAPYLHRLVPVVGIQFNAANPVDAFADILLNQGSAVEQAKGADPRWRPHRVPLQVLARRLTKSREEFGLSPSRRYIVSALSAGRLETALFRLAADWRADLWDILDGQPDLDWLLVGVANVDTLRGFDPRLDGFLSAGRIKVFGFVDDLRSLYPHCEVLIHLPGMTGGGMGVAMAVEERRPVLVFAGTDPCNFLPPDATPQEWPRFVRQLRALLASEALQQTEASAQHGWMSREHGLQRTGEELLAYVLEAAESRERMRRSVVEA